MLDDDPLAKSKSSGGAPEGRVDSPRPDRGSKRHPIGEIFGNRYEVREDIGSGAFAVTYRGWDLRLERAVAIKVLRDTYASEPTPVQRFEREARAAASVSQGNVVDVYDFGRQDDRLYIVMQYVKGEDLKHLITREGPLPPGRAANITIQILAGLAAIHEAGIIHRDIKPQNVLIGPDDIARVTDFGIAHVTVEAGLTTAGTTFGTATYMAPEQAEAGPLVQATDLYSVGIVLYEMLTARLPFEAPTMIALILAHIHTIPSPPSVRTPAQRITPELDAVVMRALEKHPDDRFRDAPAMAQALSAAMAHRPPGAAPAPLMATGDEQTIRTTPRRVRRAADIRPPSTARKNARMSPPSKAPRRTALLGRWMAPFVLLLLMLAGIAGGGAYLLTRDDGDDPSGDDLREIVANLTVSPTPTEQATEAPTETPVATDAPTETQVPTVPPTNTPAPTATPTETPEPTAVPTATPPPTLAPTDPPFPTPTDTPEQLPTETPPLIVPRNSDVESDEGSTVGSDQSGDDGISSGSDTEGPGTVTLDFTASDWQGAYFQETGNMRAWSGVYAQSTGYGSGSLGFSLDGTPASDTFSLTVNGMTSENWSEVPMSLLINGEEVYEGTSPFPTWNGVEGEQPWATVNVELPTSVLQQGENTVTFVNGVEQGDFSRPPYILLAGGTVTIELVSGG